jgi:hypothetical protein
VAYKLSTTSAKKLWEVPDLNGFGYYPPMPVAGKYVFFANSRDDSEKKTHVVVDLMTGKRISTVNGLAPSNGGYLLGMENLVLVRPDGTHGETHFASYKVDAAGHAKILHPDGWAPSFSNSTSYHMPVMYPVAEGRIFLRLGDGIYCYDLRASPGQVKVDQAIRAAGADADAVISGLLPLATDADVQVRETAGRELAVRVAAGQASNRQADVLPVLLRLTAENDPPLRRQLASTLATFGANALPALAEAARQPNENVRLSVVETLGHLGSLDDPQIDAILVGALGETSRALLETALNSVVQRTGKLDVYQPVLVRLIDAAEMPVDRAALGTLLMLLPENTLPTPRPKKLEALLVDLMASKDTARGQRAVAAIRALGDDEALRIFSSVLQAENPQSGTQVVRAVKGLAEMGGLAKPALAALEQAMAKRQSSRQFTRTAQAAIKAIQEAQ